MNDPFGLAVAMGVGLSLLGVGTAAVQLRGLRHLTARSHVPSDEQRYLRSRYRRRLLIAAVLILAGAMIGGAYLSGMEARAAALGEAKPHAPKPIIGDADWQFARLWTIYWAGVLVLSFALVGLALLDSLATRRYWYAQYGRLREEHQTRLRRDLAVYRSRKTDRLRGTDRGGSEFGGRLGGG